VGGDASPPPRIFRRESSTTIFHQISDNPSSDSCFRSSCVTESGQWKQKHRSFQPQAVGAARCPRQRPLRQSQGRVAKEAGRSRLLSPLRQEHGSYVRGEGQAQICGEPHPEGLQPVQAIDFKLQQWTVARRSYAEVVAGVPRGKPLQAGSPELLPAASAGRRHKVRFNPCVSVTTFRSEWAPAWLGWPSPSCRPRSRYIQSPAAPILKKSREEKRHQELEALERKSSQRSVQTSSPSQQTVYSSAHASTEMTPEQDWQVVVRKNRGRSKASVISQLPAPLQTSRENFKKKGR
jgi:hypothetical protein